MGETTIIENSNKIAVTSDEIIYFITDSRTDPTNTSRLLKFEEIA